MERMDQVKKYRARSMRDAIKAIKAELGPDAVILSTREIKKDLNGQRLLEITAANSSGYKDSENIKGVSSNFDRKKVETVGTEKPNNVNAKNKLNDFVGNLTKEMTDIKDSLRSMFRERQKWESDEMTYIKSEIDELKRVLFPLAGHATASRNHSLTVDQAQIYNELCENGVYSDHAKELVKHAPASHNNGTVGAEAIRTHVATKMLGSIEVSGQVTPTRGVRRIDAFVGPTGVGKTTTIAKIAADAALKSHMKVGLISLDTFRIAAIDQLRKFADIIGIPLEVAVSRDGLRRAFDKFANKDLILIDTAGCNPLDIDNIKRLTKLLEGFDINIHLVISSNLNSNNLKKVSSNFLNLNYNYLLFTKLDESESFGVIYSLHREFSKPLSYFTNGQRVPEDIEKAEREKLTRLVLNPRIN